MADYNISGYPCLKLFHVGQSEYTPLLPHVDEDILGTAMQGAGWFSKIVFTWVNPLLQKGNISFKMYQKNFFISYFEILMETYIIRTFQ